MKNRNEQVGGFIKNTKPNKPRRNVEQGFATNGGKPVSKNQRRARCAEKRGMEY